MTNIESQLNPLFKILATTENIVLVCDRLVIMTEDIGSEYTFGAFYRALSTFMVKIYRCYAKKARSVLGETRRLDVMVRRAIEEGIKLRKRAHKRAPRRKRALTVGSDEDGPLIQLHMPTLEEVNESLRRTIEKQKRRATLNEEAITIRPAPPVPRIEYREPEVYSQDQIDAIEKFMDEFISRSFPDRQAEQGSSLDQPTRWISQSLSNPERNDLGEGAMQFNMPVNQASESRAPKDNLEALLRQILETKKPRAKRTPKKYSLEVDKITDSWWLPKEKSWYFQKRRKSLDVVKAVLAAPMFFLDATVFMANQIFGFKLSFEFPLYLTTRQMLCYNRDPTPLTGRSMSILRSLTVQQQTPRQSLKRRKSSISRSRHSDILPAKRFDNIHNAPTVINTSYAFDVNDFEERIRTKSSQLDNSFAHKEIAPRVPTSGCTFESLIPRNASRRGVAALFTRLLSEAAEKRVVVKQGMSHGDIVIEPKAHPGPGAANNQS